MRDAMYYLSVGSMLIFSLRILSASRQSLRRLGSATPHLRFDVFAPNVTQSIGHRDENELEFNGGHAVTTSPYSYVFMAWNVNPSDERDINYRAYLSHVLVSARLLRRYGSQADINMIFKFAKTCNRSAIPEFEADLLERMNIKVRYLRETDETYDWVNDTGWNSWARMMHKFYILRLTEYRRVMFLDGDLLPIRNLDYLFEQSDGGVLKENVIVASNREPANGGTMLFTPSFSKYRIVKEMIQNEGFNQGQNRFWNTTEGWGRVLSSSESWQTNDIGNSGMKWDFWAADIDQGFSYYYCKYIARSCSQLLSHAIYNFGKGLDGDTFLEQEWKIKSEDDHPLVTKRDQLQGRISSRKCPAFTGKESLGEAWPGCLPPWSDFEHFTGNDKPWLRQAKRLRHPTPQSTTQLWFHEIMKLKEEFAIDASWFRFPLPAPRNVTEE